MRKEGDRKDANQAKMTYGQAAHSLGKIVDSHQRLQASVLSALAQLAEFGIQYPQANMVLTTTDTDISNDNSGEEQEAGFSLKH